MISLFFSRIKAYLIGGLFFAVLAFTINQAFQLSAEKTKNQTLITSLENSLAETAALSIHLADSEKLLKSAVAEIARRDELAARSEAYTTNLGKLIDKQKEQLIQLKKQNEQFKNWSGQPVPDVVGQLLNNARAEIENSS